MFWSKIVRLKKFRPKIFRPKKFRPEIFLTVAVSAKPRSGGVRPAPPGRLPLPERGFADTATTKFLSDQICFWLNFFVGRKLLWPKIVSAEKFFVENVSAEKFFDRPFFGRKTVRPKFFFRPKHFRRKNFRSKKISAEIFFG